MIVYFADRQLNIIGQASTELPDGLVISGDKKVSEIETGVSTFECDITFDKKTRSKVEECTQVGNYILRSHDGETELYTIIDAEIDTKKQEVYIYAEDDGMDLLNEVVGVYEADKAYPIDHYINKYAAGAGFVIGINEAKGLTRQLSWDGESTATARIASVATQFDGCEISFSFEVDRLYVVKKFINIYKQRGKDVGITLRLNQDIDSIITSKSIGNLATALQCTGGTIDQSSTILEAAKSSGSPQVAYTVDLKCIGRTKTAVKFNATVSAALTNEDAKLAEDYGLKASIFIGGSWHSVTLKATTGDNKREWSGTASNSVEYEFTAPASSAGVVTYSGIKLKVERTDSKGGSIGVLSERACNNYSVPNYIEGGDNGEDIESRNITIEGYTYDDGDFYIDGNVLKSKKALQNWSRVVWKTEESQKNGGHITKLYSYDTPSQQTLCNRAITELKKLREMEINYDVEIKKFPENVKIGDRVNIVDDAGELYVSARVLKLEQSVSDDEHKATLGEYLIKSSGIHQKVAELAEQFAKAAVSASRALSIANNAKAAAVEARQQAESVAGDIQTAQQAAQAALEAANGAEQSASVAQEKATQAEQAVDKVEQSVSGMEESIVNAQQAAQQAQQAAQNAETKATEAQQASANAQTKANEAVTAAGNAQTKAESATTKADTAKSAADQAIADAEAAATTAAAAKREADGALEGFLAVYESLSTLENTMAADFARKTDLTEVEAHLQSQIKQNAAEISSTVTKVQRVDETANDSHKLLQGALYWAEKAQEQADQAAAEAEAAQVAADQAAQAAEDAQAEANTAKAAAEEAQSDLDEAQAVLNLKMREVVRLEFDSSATESDINQALEALAIARNFANEAKAKADAAAATATEAQALAVAAVLNANNAQEIADKAASNAAIAQRVADEAKGDATAAQQAADEAAEEAANAQLAAQSAVEGAVNAQNIASNASKTAATAERTASEAQVKADQAASDLAKAQQNLANVMAKVDATAEEIAAAQAAVNAAQAFADAAQADAQSAQAAANTARETATAAKASADAAQVAAEEAQQAADEALKAAQEAQGVVYGLANRVETAETQITQNANRIALTATKKEVAEALSGYSTTEETAAAIRIESDSIQSTVSRTIEGIQIGGRNLIRNSTNLSNDNYYFRSGVATSAVKTASGGIVTMSDISAEDPALTVSIASEADSIDPASVTVAACGKNLFDNTKTTFSNQYIYWKNTSNLGVAVNSSSFSCSGEIPVAHLQGRTITLNRSPYGIVESDDNAGNAGAAFYDENHTAIPNSGTNGSKLVVPSNAHYLRFSVPRSYADGTQVQLELGDSVTNFEAYAGQTVMANADGTVEGLVAVFPTTNIFAETAGVTVTVTYNRVAALSSYQGTTPTGGTDEIARLLIEEVQLPEAFVLSGVKAIGKVYTLSFWLKSDEAGSVIVNGQSLATSSVWSKYTVTFTADSADLAFEFGTAGIYHIYHLQLESGNKATDWKEAPEDVADEVSDAQNAANEAQSTADSAAEKIASAESTIQQLADSIAALVRDGNGGSLIRQDANGLWYFNIGGIEESLSDTANNLDSLEGLVRDANGQIDVLKSTAEALQGRTEYVKSYTDENGQPCLELGEGDSVFKVRITNTEIQFAEGTAVPAKINRQMLVIEKAMVRSELQFGDDSDSTVDGVWILKRRSNGNLGLMWKVV